MVVIKTRTTKSFLVITFLLKNRVKSKLRFWFDRQTKRCYGLKEHRLLSTFILEGISGCLKEGQLNAGLKEKKTKIPFSSLSASKMPL
jgi:hypothetical protein